MSKFWLLIPAIAVGYFGVLLMAPPRPQVVKDSQPKVVTVLVKGNGPGGHMGTGSYVSADGMVLTCAHLFREGNKLTLVRTPGGAIGKAELVRLDIKHDLAVIKSYPVHPVPYFELGKCPFIGQKVFAFGAPMGIVGTVTQGWVSNIGVSTEYYTLHTAPINPGNSGGPLVDEEGKLIGVNVSMLLFNPFAPAQLMANAVNLTYILRILED